METIHTHSRKKKSTTKTSVIIAIVVHVLMAVAGAFWAAHEGMLGAKLQNLAVFMVPKEKKADEPKKAEPKEVAKKEEEPKEVQQAVRSTPAPPKFEAPPGAGGPAAPPPAAIIPAISFANALDSGDSVAVYKQRVETALRSRWDRPSGVQDLDYVAEVEMSVDPQGKVTGYTWKKGSGNQNWDKSVKDVMASTKTITPPPPSGFPDKFLVRFDVQPATEPLVSRAD